MPVVTSAWLTRNAGFRRSRNLQVIKRGTKVNLQRGREYRTLLQCRRETRFEEGGEIRGGKPVLLMEEQAKSQGGMEGKAFLHDLST